MRRLDVLGAGQIGEGAGQLDALRAVVGAGAELHLGHRRFHQGAQPALWVLVLVSSIGQKWPLWVSAGPIWFLYQAL